MNYILLKELMKQSETECGFDSDKFAELIVAECVKLCEHESNDDEYDQYDMGQSVKAENIKTAIKEHFGVEE
jgi:hypothetical protein